MTGDGVGAGGSRRARAGRADHRDAERSQATAGRVGAL